MPRDFEVVNVLFPVTPDLTGGRHVANILTVSPKLARTFTGEGGRNDPGR
jgi:hypothetical protein